MEFQPYKLQPLARRVATIRTLWRSVGAELTMYDNVDRRDQTVWTDRVAGRTFPTTRYITPNAFKLLRTAAVYWLSNEHNPQLQRDSGTAWPDKEAMVCAPDLPGGGRKTRSPAARRRTDLFSIPEEIGSGLAVFHPKGGIIRREMEDYSRRRHEEGGYDFVYSHTTKAGLFETSGHLTGYKATACTRRCIWTRSATATATSARAAWSIT